MKTAILKALVITTSITMTCAAFAHGDQSHPKCKKGYVLTDDHKCVKKN